MNSPENHLADCAACLHPHPDDASRLIADIPSPCVQNHAANLMPLANGDIGCVWFGGRPGREIGYFDLFLSPAERGGVLDRSGHAFR